MALPPTIYGCTLNKHLWSRSFQDIYVVEKPPTKLRIYSDTSEANPKEMHNTVPESIPQRLPPSGIYPDCPHENDIEAWQKHIAIGDDKFHIFYPDQQFAEDHRPFVLKVSGLHDGKWIYQDMEEWSPSFWNEWSLSLRKLQAAIKEGGAFSLRDVPRLGKDQEKPSELFEEFTRVLDQRIQGPHEPTG